MLPSQVSFAQVCCIIINPCSIPKILTDCHVVGLAKPINQPFHCPMGLHCGPGPVCTIEMCDLPGCAESPVCTETQTPPFHCPDGLHCGHGPVCTAATCGLPGCADLPICTAINEKRAPKFGPGPVCTPYTCGLPGCQGLPMCAVKSIKITATTDNNATNTTIPGKLPSVECTSASCHLPGCAEAAICACTIEDCAQPACAVTDVCKGINNTEQKVGRAFAVSGKLPQVECTPATCGLPGCAGAEVCVKNASPTSTGLPGKLPKVQCTSASCHLPGCASADVCIKHTTPTESAVSTDHSNHTIHHPCPDICDQDGNCGCSYEAVNGKVKRVAVGDIIHPCPLICNKERECWCNYADKEKRVAGSTDKSKFCPMVCDEEGNCGCNYGVGDETPPA